MGLATSKLPFLEIIEWIEHDPNVMMWKIADGDREIKNGAKLIVRDSQKAMFMNEGKIADIFDSGTFSLTTQNIPILSRLRGWKYGFESPFKADVYFFSVKQFVNLKWGTASPIILRDAQFGQVRLRAFGSYNIRIVDGGRFFNEYAGTHPQLTIFEFERQLRDFIAPRLGEAMAQSGIPLLDTARDLSELNARIQPLIKPYFDDFGIEITQFTVSSINLPEEVTQYYDKVTGMNMVGDQMDKFQQFNTAVAISQEGNPAQQGAQQGLAMGMLVNGMDKAQQAPAKAANPTPEVNPKSEKTDKPENVTKTYGTEDIAEKLKQVKDLFEKGLIDEDEYKSLKSNLISRI